ncbi:MAG: stage II sporulation protein M [Desulfurococcales archaeon]|nr:stage II sporulation protein M [Desulfurococcales archaeon]
MTVLGEMKVLHEAFMLISNRKVYALILLFLLFFTVGLVFYSDILNSLSWAGLSKKELENSIREKFSFSKETLLFIPIIIFVNNLVASVITFLLGFTILGPILILLYNGLITGLVVSIGLNASEFFGQSVVALLIPHGCLEIPTISFSGAIPAYYMLTRGKLDRNTLFGALKVVLYTLLTLAIVETFITPGIAIVDALFSKVIEAAVSMLY